MVTFTATVLQDANLHWHRARLQVDPQDSRTRQSACQLCGQLKSLKTKMSHSKDADLNTFKPEIRTLLEQEIAGHYYLQKGLKEASFATDPDMKAALDLFKDMGRYNSILKGK